MGSTNVGPLAEAVDIEGTRVKLHSCSSSWSDDEHICRWSAGVKRSGGLKGRIDHKEGETKLIAMEVAPFEATPERSEVRLKLDARKAPAGTIQELAALLREYPGEAPVVAAIETSGGPLTLAFGPGYRVRPEPDLFAEVKSLLGEAAIS